MALANFNATAWQANRGQSRDGDESYLRITRFVKQLVQTKEQKSQAYTNIYTHARKANMNTRTHTRACAHKHAQAPMLTFRSRSLVSTGVSLYTPG